MENTVKITKAMVLTAIEKYFEESEATEVIFDGVTVGDILEYTGKTKEQLANKAAKAQEKAAEKKTAGDELRAAVKAVLTDELQTREQIFAKVEGEDLTVAKIGARLTQLVANGEARKEQIKVEDRKVMAYALVTEEAEADAE